MSELTVQYLVLERCDPARNMARFYVLTIEPTELPRALLNFMKRSLP